MKKEHHGKLITRGTSYGLLVLKFASQMERVYDLDAKSVIVPGDMISGNYRGDGDVIPGRRGKRSNFELDIRNNWVGM